MYRQIRTNIARVRGPGGRWDQQYLELRNLQLSIERAVSRRASAYPETVALTCSSCAVFAVGEKPKKSKEMWSYLLLERIRRD
jgi:hypothetical protein